MNWRRFIGRGASAVFDFRYEREDGQFREITVPNGYGRFRRGSIKEAFKLAEIRLAEQYGDMTFVIEAQAQRADPNIVHAAAELLRTDSRLHQSNYKLVEAKKV